MGYLNLSIFNFNLYYRPLSQILEWIIFRRNFRVRYSAQYLVCLYAFCLSTKIEDFTVPISKKSKTWKVEEIIIAEKIDLTGNREYRKSKIVIRRLKKDVGAWIKSHLAADWERTKVLRYERETEKTSARNSTKKAGDWKCFYEKRSQRLSSKKGTKTVTSTRKIGKC